MPQGVAAALVIALARVAFLMGDASRPPVSGSACEQFAQLDGVAAHWVYRMHICVQVYTAG